MARRLPDIVGQHEIAERLGVSRALVNAWAARPHVQFPAPALTLRAGRFWLWSEVQEWAANHRGENNQ